MRQEDFEQILLLLAEINADRSQKEAAHNSSDEFTSEVGIHLLFVVQFWQSTWHIFTLWFTAFFSDDYNHVHNILILFDGWENFPFTKSKTKHDY